jgi:hypothetical protein
MKTYKDCEAKIDGITHFYTLNIFEDSEFDITYVVQCFEDEKQIEVDPPVKLWSYYQEKFTPTYDVDQYGNRYDHTTDYSPTEKLVL